jgi:hypothetical protein
MRIPQASAVYDRRLRHGSRLGHGRFMLSLQARILRWAATSLAGCNQVRQLRKTLH